MAYALPSSSESEMTTVDPWVDCCTPTELDSELVLLLPLEEDEIDCMEWRYM